MILLDDRIICNNKFPDGTLALRVELDDRHTEHILVWNYESDEEMMVIYYICKHLKNSNHTTTLFMPYIPNARMDRVKNDDEIFTLKYFADFLNSLDFRAVYVRDPHSNVSTALIHNLGIEDISHYIISTIEQINDESLVMYYPDEGAMKRYSELVQGKPYSFGIKRRDWRTGNIEGITLMNEEIVKDKNILIVDDICSKGGTFYHSAKALKNAGAKDIYLYVTHCENTIFRGELIDSDLIKHIFTTRSIFTLAHEKISIL